MSKPKKRNRHPLSTPAQHSPQPKQREIIATQATYSSGPLPSPDVMIKYAQLDPNIPKAIVDIFQKQTQHRMHIERTVIEGNNRRSYIGQIMAFILALLCILFSFWCIATGKNIAGLSTLFGSIAALVGVFVYGRYESQKERSKK